MDCCFLMGERYRRPEVKPPRSKMKVVLYVVPGHDRPHVAVEELCQTENMIRTQVDEVKVFPAYSWAPESLIARESV